MPTEKAEKKIDSLAKKFNVLKSTYDSVSSGASVMAQLTAMQDTGYSIASANKTSAKRDLDNAKAITAKAKSNLTKKQQKKAKNGKTISTKGLKGKSLKNAKAYNDAVRKQKNAQSNYNDAISVVASFSSTSLSRKYTGSQSYQYANALLDQEVANQKLQDAQYQQAYVESTKNLNNAKAAKDSANSKAVNKGKSLANKYAKKLNASQKNALESGKTVSLSGITDKNLKKKLQEYNKLVAQAQTATQKYNIALEAQQTAMENASTSQAELAQMIVETETKKFDNIKNHYDELLSYQKTLNDQEEKSIELAKAHGDYVAQSDYQKQLANTQNEMKLAQGKANRLQAQLNSSVASGVIKEGSDEWLNLRTQVVEAENSVKDYGIQIENLKQEALEAKYAEMFDRAIDKAGQYIDKLETINGLITDEMMYDYDTGELTDMGMLSLALNKGELDKNIGILQTYVKKRQEIINDYNAGKFGEEEFNNQMKENDSSINSYISAINSSRNKILDIVKNQGKSELDALNKVIEARKDALQKKKDYYDYDKTLKDKTKEINLLKQQIAALDGVTDAESRAKKARLEAELADAQDDLDSTVKDHIYELQVTGLDELSDQLNEDYEKYVNELSSNLEKMTETINNCVKSTAVNTTQALATMNNLLKAYGINISAEDFLNISGSFAKGTRHVSRKGIYRTQEKGGEIIVTKDEVFMPLNVGDKVFTNDMTERLYDIASGDNNYTAPTFTLPKIDFPDIPDSGGEYVITNHYDSLINVNGNVDKYVVDDIKKLGKDLLNDRDFKNGSFKFITSEIAKDLRK